jgi:transposase
VTARCSCDGFGAISNPHLQFGDIVLFDNLRAHKAPVVQEIVERRGATVTLPPPCSSDFNPIEAGWAPIEKHIRTCALPTGDALCRVARFIV